MSSQNKPDIHAVAYISFRLQKNHIQHQHWNTKGSSLSPTHSPTHTYTAQTGAGARGSAAGFPGSLTGLMEALCLKPGQTTADSRGDAYQLLAMLRPEGERGRDRNNGEREGERELEKERGLQYKMLNGKKKLPATTQK